MAQAKRPAEADADSNLQPVAKIAKAGTVPILSGIKTTTLCDGSHVDYLLVKVVQATEGDESSWKPEAELDTLVKGGIAAWVADAKDIVVFAHGWMTNWDALGGGDDPTDTVPATLQCLADAELLTKRRAEGTPPLAKLRFICIYWPSDQFGAFSDLTFLQDAASASFADVPDNVKAPAMAALTKLQGDPTAVADGADTDAINTALAAATLGRSKWRDPDVPDTKDAAAAAAAVAASAPKVSKTVKSVPDDSVASGTAAAVSGTTPAAKTPSETQELLISVKNIVTFWQMKNRAYKVGATAVPIVLSSLADAAPESSGRRIHLHGHSFGTVVMSEAAREWHERGAALARSVKPPARIGSLTLMQGAISCMVFSGECEYHPYSLNLFDKKARGRLVDVPASLIGPLVATTAKRDMALPFHAPAMRIGHLDPPDFADTTSNKPPGPAAKEVYEDVEGAGPAGASWEVALGVTGLVNADASSPAFVIKQSIVEAGPKAVYDFGRKSHEGRKNVFTMNGDGTYKTASGEAAAFITSHGGYKNPHVGAMLWEAFDASRPGGNNPAKAA